MSEKNDIPRIRQITDIGTAMFQVVKYVEPVLQGWSKEHGRQVYLFRAEESGKWAYYDKDQGGLVEVDQWKGKSAWIQDDWVSLSKYHRLHLRFVAPVTYKVFEKGEQRSEDTEEAMIVLTDTAYKTLQDQMQGRGDNAVYQFSFKTKKKPKGGTMTYVEKVVFAGEIEG